MREKAAVILSLVLTGKYRVPNQKFAVKGWDQYGNEITETVDGVDWERLNKDAEAILTSSPQ